MNTEPFGYWNWTNSVVATGRQAGTSATATFAVFMGERAGNGSASSYSVGVGNAALDSATSDYAIAVGDNAAYNAQGRGLVALGAEAGSNNNADSVLALGRQAGVGNTLPISTIINGNYLPQYANQAAAIAGISTGTGAITGNYYLYYNTTNFTIDAVLV
jgi:hypothetical protein